MLNLTACIQRLPDILEQILRVFAAGAEANKAIWNRVASPARAALGGCADAAEAGGGQNQPTG